MFALRSQLPLRSLQAVDLGTGTGSNIRYLASRLGGEQRWVAVDNDPTLIERQNFQCDVVTSTRRPRDRFELTVAGGLPARHGIGAARSGIC